MRLSVAPAALALAASLAFAPTAAAEYDIAYLGLRGTYVFVDDTSSSGTGFLDYDAQHDDGYGGGVFIGWVLDDNFRLEAEGMYRSWNLGPVTIVRDDSTPLPFTLPGEVYNPTGDIHSVSVMGNLYYDLHIFDGAILPWIGAGIGGVYVDYSIAGSVVDPNFPPTVLYPLFDASGSNWVFGYQFMAGFTFPVAEGISMSLGYRFLQTQDFEYSNGTDEFVTDMTLQNVDLSLQFHL